jgi:hypothetical protein
LQHKLNANYKANSMKMNINLMKTYMPKQNNCNANKSTTSTKTSAKKRTCKHKVQRKHLQVQSTKKTLISTKKNKGRIKRCKCTQKNHLQSQRITKVEWGLWNVRMVVFVCFHVWINKECNDRKIYYLLPYGVNVDLILN